MQKDIFYEEMRLLKLPGWEIWEEGDIVAFKSPVPLPLINFTYGTPSLMVFEKIKNFYRNDSFTWLMPHAEDCSFFADHGFGPTDTTFEMIVDLTQYVHCEPPKYIQVREVQTDEDFSLWISIAAQCFSVRPDLFNTFFSVWRTIKRYIFYLGYVDGIPSGTSLIGLSSHGAALYSIGTVAEFRRRGLGTHVIRACLQVAKLHGLTNAVLYASDLGRPVYEKLGFKLFQTWEDFTFESFNPLERVQVHGEV